VNLEIRVATSHDAHAIADLHRRSSLVRDDTRDALLAHPELFVPPYEAIAEGRVLVADGGRILAFVTIAIRRECLEIEDLFVAPEVMRHGLGRALVEHVVDEARTQGAGRAEALANVHAEAFYETCGFRAAAAGATRFGPALRMERAIG
jgi:GNAT superfamily N-acetyltransferase